MIVLKILTKICASPLSPTAGHPPHCITQRKFRTSSYFCSTCGKLVTCSGTNAITSERARREASLPAGGRGEDEPPRRKQPATGFARGQAEAEARGCMHARHRRRTAGEARRWAERGEGQSKWEVRVKLFGTLDLGFYLVSFHK
jgi:hypothetical protein